MWLSWSHSTQDWTGPPSSGDRREHGIPSLVRDRTGWPEREQGAGAYGCRLAWARESAGSHGLRWGPLPWPGGRAGDAGELGASGAVAEREGR